MIIVSNTFDRIRESMICPLMTMMQRLGRYVIELNSFVGFTRDQKKYVLGAFARESNAHETM
jgi:hypothetical protein